MSMNCKTESIRSLTEYIQEVLRLIENETEIAKAEKE